MGQFIPFGEWLPDLPTFQNPGATVAANVIPDKQSYLSFPNPTVFSTALTGRCQGAFVARDTAGNYFDYVGTSDKLSVLNGNSWSNVSRLVGGAYVTPSTDYWEFAQFGQLIIGVNGNTADVPQAMSVGAANFAALAGSPPPSKHIATIKDFVVVGNLSATAVSPQMVRWSGINDATAWAPSATTLSDMQDLPGDGGWVQKIIGGEYGTIFQQRAIFRMTFVGSPFIFQFDRVQTNIGAFVPQAVINYQNFTFFLAEDGFYVFNGSNCIPIGRGKVDRTFFAELDNNYTHRIQAIIDPIRKIVAWAYPATGNTGGNPNRILIYSWAYERWSRVESISLEFLFRGVTPATTLEGLDAYGTLETLIASLDSSLWAGGSYLFTSFDTAHKLNFFNGAAMAAKVETNEVQMNRDPDGLTYVTQVRPVAEGLSASLTIAVAARNVTTAATSYGTAISPISTGYAPVRSTGRFQRFQVVTANNVAFDHLQGVDVEANADGSR